jgi:hypothetical protein
MISFMSRALLNFKPSFQGDETNLKRQFTQFKILIYKKDMKAKAFHTSFRTKPLSTL